MTLDAFPKREYGPADVKPVYEARPYSFELNEDWLAIMAREFDIDKAAAAFAEALAGKSGEDAESIGRDFFHRYGTDLMRRSLELGEEYMDRSYEVLREASDKTDGYLAWPLIPQRFIEAALLSTQDMLVLPTIQNSPDRYQFRVEDCRMYAALKEKCGQEVAESLPCQHGCLALVEAAFRGFDLGAAASLTARTSQEGYCEFTTVRL